MLLSSFSISGYRRNALTPSRYHFSASGMPCMESESTIRGSFVNRISSAGIPLVFSNGETFPLPYHCARISAVRSFLSMWHTKPPDNFRVLTVICRNFAIITSTASSLSRSSVSAAISSCLSFFKAVSCIFPVGSSASSVLHLFSKISREQTISRSMSL